MKGPFKEIIRGVVDMKQDEMIIRQYMQRDESAIVKTKEEYGVYCRYIISNILSSQEDVEECLNDVWLHVWNAIPPSNPANLKAFVGKIARECAIDCYRKNCALKRNDSGTISLDEIEKEISAEYSLWNDIESKYITEAINTFLYQCKKEPRNIFICRYFYMDSIQDIAKQFSVSESKVKMTLHRMRIQLKKYLLKEGILNE